MVCDCQGGYLRLIDGKATCCEECVEGLTFAINEQRGNLLMLEPMRPYMVNTLLKAHHNADIGHACDRLKELEAKLVEVQGE